MKEKISYSKLALNAMCRASKEAQKKAADHNLKIPIWKDGNIVYMEPKQILTKKYS
jgi:hypothetical protein